MNQKKIFITAFILVGMLASGVAVSQSVRLNPIKPGQKLTAQISDEQQAVLAVRKAKASVVNIEGFKSYLGNGNSTPTVEPTNGSGFIYSSDGLIISNSHVVKDKDAEYIVVLADGSRHTAKVLGLDEFNDVAVLKIEAKNLPVAVLANSADLETGQSVFAIGNSLGIYQNTVTKGIVSGLGRMVDVSSSLDPKPRFQNLIQTDAAINPGNSGGPLVNFLGEVIGINTAIDRTGEAVGFAVPINTVKDSVSQLLTLGKVSRPRLGITFATITRSVKVLNNLQVSEGALVEGVTAGGPADLAGLAVNDIVIEINREKITQKNQLDTVVQKYRAGDTILITFLRNGETMQTPVLLAEFK